MRVLVTGASGWIGSATVTALLTAGHQVTGLARSDAAAARIGALGATPVHGDIEDLDGLRAAAADSEGVVHLGYNHDFSRMAEAARTDRAAIEALGAGLAGTGRPLLIAAGVLGLAATGRSEEAATGRAEEAATGRGEGAGSGRDEGAATGRGEDAGSGPVAVETDGPAPGVHPRGANSAVALALADQGVRPLVVRFAPTVHGAGDHGFIAALVAAARQRGVSGYAEDGATRWPAVHVRDAAELIRLAIEDAPAGSVLHATAEEGVPARVIAEAIGAGLGLPVASVPADRIDEHFGWIGRLFALDAPASSAATRRLLGWKPTRPTLLDDLAAGHYFG
ncbi:nucleoside-diphosphate-sugar epimerase [Actinoplanes octamycinicus]|uniref:Nucleoside-diphosphate-sugar epimerase n=1 Tax=Actinoplanes octamycinicus TaxID=135948 RepID=A0A7W7M7M7_9ACTN|nr:SDR family oxidoreductase [Actinoplanes octamycinicus]MBB4740057.1 nucleoside-diphosphate-sugar epimerase [Actinoplanes octamycinicus]GIE59452.1 dehydratase [Actinoplanes octamycinicus]